jgi:hypothetical protein
VGHDDRRREEWLKSVFISFDYDNDAHYKNMLLAWDKNHAFDIKSKIKPLIEKSSHVLCLVGKESAKSDWINWEVQTGADAKKKLIGVKIDNSYTSPSALLNNGSSWARSFTFDSIKNAFDAA